MLGPTAAVRKVIFSRGSCGECAYNCGAGRRLVDVQAELGVPVLKLDRRGRKLCPEPVVLVGIGAVDDLERLANVIRQSLNRGVHLQAPGHRLRKGLLEPVHARDNGVEQNQIPMDSFSDNSHGLSITLLKPAELGEGRGQVLVTHHARTTRRDADR